MIGPKINFPFATFMMVYSTLSSQKMTSSTKRAVDTTRKAGESMDDAKLINAVSSVINGKIIAHQVLFELGFGQWI
jgi:hypothetical protein